MSIQKVVYFLLFEISFTESANIITEFDVLFLDETQHLNQLRHDAGLEAIISDKTQRMVFDFKRKVFVDSGLIFNSGNQTFFFGNKLCLPDQSF